MTGTKLEAGRARQKVTGKRKPPPALLRPAHSGPPVTPPACAIKDSQPERRWDHEKIVSVSFHGPACVIKDSQPERRQHRLRKACRL